MKHLFHSFEYRAGSHKMKMCEKSRGERRRESRWATGGGREKKPGGGTEGRGGMEDGRMWRGGG